MACWETLLVDGVDLQTYGWIVSAEGLLATGPYRGDLILQDWVPGAIWQPGPRDTYSFEVPVLMTSPQQDIALGRLRAIQAWQGDQKTLTRRLTVYGTEISETCQAVMVNAVQVSWDFGQRSKVGAVLVWQNLTGGWS